MLQDMTRKYSMKAMIKNCLAWLKYWLSLCTHFWVGLIAFGVFFQRAEQNVQKIAVLFALTSLNFAGFRNFLSLILWSSHKAFFLICNGQYWFVAGLNQFIDKFFSVQDHPNRFIIYLVLRFFGIIVFSDGDSLYCLYLHQIIWYLLLHLLWLFFIQLRLGLFI